MSCGCKEGNVYNIGMGCCVPSIMPADDFYTKPQIDEMLEDIVESGCCITPEQVDEKIEQAVSGKQDTLSAGTNIIIVDNVISASGCDLTGYATEQWVEDKHYLTEHQPLKTINNQVISGTGNIEITGSSVVVDPTLNSGSTNPVANSAITIVIDNKLDASAYTPIDISAYAPKVWVQQNFTTNSTVIQYITNLQQQIDNLEARLEECCSQSGETLYRWVTMTGASDYVCSGTTKMSKEREESSSDGGVTWTPTGNYRTGSTVLEYNSEDCGYIAPMKFNGVLLNHNTVNIPCNESTTLTSGETYTTNAYTSIEIGECVTNIGGDAFSNQVFLTGNLTLPNSIRTIGDSAFRKCDGLSGLTLNNGLQTIGEHSFDYCTGFTSIVIPDTVTSIGLQAFYLHRASTIIIGSGVTSIGLSAFETNSSNVQSATINATTPPTIQDTGTAFTFRGSYPIYVPSGSVNAYKTGNWSVYADRILPIT